MNVFTVNMLVQVKRSAISEHINLYARVKFQDVEGA